ncbi:hypothetical protein P175DRAFT_0502603 [Aspergillus ochraceoroseus IBT 24754]|uniref:Serine hydrolase domain-containing protein n=3 Tax=Aspergillus subgen. Nidulantes TaxID=2720870 RepID=A0A0F8VN10_9EURO|nr:uncharacterized protein P175DRAFT_0502603 [Aspergillus ochraceoroseus IBT 24754]KKK20319.1 hypothetical protein AOCH_002258 [Aspergillus ochraceoroseus]KKK24516.1 hypothetical protein ARAM_002350 [Aspergillus rambellii]PTU19093.1 hypothetical protein P175DRAFT_0502603 [Aspergillus ochraceoroseus IBT 24754]
MKSLPRIACFHGGGSKGDIFEVQCAFLAQILEDDFQFEFFDGPFDSPAGPGILPAFEGYGPYKTWFTKDATTGAERADGSGYDQIGRDGVERIWKMMEVRSGSGGSGDWVGVMGFSQGTRMAGGLLLDQQRREELGEPGSPIKLKFGILCMGGKAPMESEIGHRVAQSDTVIRIPTLHVHGLKDEFLAWGRDQYDTYYHPETRTLHEINYHHAMPWVREEAEELADRIRKLYKNTQTL